MNIETPLCECGCGEHVRLKNHRYVKVQAKDKIREAWLLKQGWKIIKIIGDEIQNIEFVKKTINKGINGKN